MEDTDAEKSQIESEPAYEINLLDKIPDVLNKANGKIPLRMQIAMLVKALGRDKKKVEKIIAESATENSAKTTENRRI